jgi:hypothetical protein
MAGMALLWKFQYVPSRRAFEAGKMWFWPCSIAHRCCSNCSEVTITTRDNGWLLINNILLVSFLLI